MAVEFDIEEVLELTKKDKYATVVGGFEFIDVSRSVELPKKFRRRKEAVKSMYALSNDIVKWDYISEEERASLREVLGISTPEEEALAMATPQERASAMAATEALALASPAARADMKDDTEGPDLVDAEKEAELAAPSVDGNASKE